MILAVQRAIDQFCKPRRNILSKAGQFGVTCNSCAFRRKRFPTVAVPARAGDRRMRTDYHMSKFTCGSAFATVNLTVKNDSRADAFRNQNKNKIARVAYLRSSKPKFRQGNSISIVVDHY